MKKKSLSSPRQPRPSMKEIRREFVQGLIVDEGLDVWRCWPSIEKLASRHSVDPEMIRTAASKVGRDGLNWIQHQTAFQDEVRLSDPEAEERVPGPSAEDIVRFREAINQVAEAIAERAVRAYLWGEPSPKNRSIFLGTLNNLREITGASKKNG